jgi:hypothetical protein
MSQRDKIYTWWNRQPKTVRKPLVLLFGLLLVFISPFTGILPGPGGIPIFILGMAILASEFDWADRLKDFILRAIPHWVRRYWHLTPRWLYFFDLVGFALIIIGIELLIWPIYLPVMGLHSSFPFFYFIPGEHQEWWIMAAIYIISGCSVIIFNRNRIKWVKRQAQRLYRKVA